MTSACINFPEPLSSSFCACNPAPYFCWMSQIQLHSFSRFSKSERLILQYWVILFRLYIQCSRNQRRPITGNESSSWPNSSEQYFDKHHGLDIAQYFYKCKVWPFQLSMQPEMPCEIPLLKEKGTPRNRISGDILGSCQRLGLGS